MEKAEVNSQMTNLTEDPKKSMQKELMTIKVVGHKINIQKPVVAWLAWLS